MTKFDRRAFSEAAERPNGFRAIVDEFERLHEEVAGLVSRVRHLETRADGNADRFTRLDAAIRDAAGGYRANKGDLDRAVSAMNEQIKELRAAIKKLQEPPKPETGWAVVDEDGDPYTRDAGFTDDYGLDDAIWFDTEAEAAVLAKALGRDTRPALLNRETLEEVG